MQVEVAGSLQQVSPAEWDALLGPDDAPLLGWSYLQGLEQTGCVGAGTSWRPAHLLLRGGAGAELLAAAPAYVKGDSEGEWVYDLDWAEFAARSGRAYYPKLVLAVPFNPIGGRRLLVPPALAPAEAHRRRLLLLSAARALCAEARLSSVHVLFHKEEERPALAEAGFALRAQEQYHFHNEGYGSFEDFLGRLRHGRRKSIRRERRALREAGITVRTLRGLADAGLDLPVGELGAGPGFSRGELDAMFDLYVGTSRRYTGEQPYLNRAFFHLLAERIGDRLELVLARGPDGALLGGAFNLRGDRRLYGRYWGRALEVDEDPAEGAGAAQEGAEAGALPYLHFEVCFYHSMERCIAEGYAAFEPGHGGEQKLLRGFWPVLTYSAHLLREPGLHGAIAQFLQMEAPYVTAALAESRRRCPLRSDAFNREIGGEGEGDV